MWQSLINHIEPWIVTAVTTLIGALFAYFGRHFPKLIKVWIGQKVYSHIESLTEKVVQSLAQTFVQPEKNANTWNADTILQATHKAKQQVEQMLPEYVKILANWLKMDLPSHIDTFLQSAVWTNPTNKPAQPAPQPAKSTRGRKKSNKTA